MPVPEFRTTTVAVPGVIGPYEAVVPQGTRHPAAGARFAPATAWEIARATCRTSVDFFPVRLWTPTADAGYRVDYFDAPTRTRKTVELQLDADGLLHLPAEHFPWQEVHPGTLDDLEPALTSAGLSVSRVHDPDHHTALMVNLDNGDAVRLVDVPGAVRWILTPFDGLLTRYRPGTTDLTHHIGQLARTPHSPFLGEVFHTYLMVWAQLANTTARVRIEPDTEHTARVRVYLPDGYQIDVIRRPAQPGESGWVLRHTFPSRHRPGAPIAAVRAAAFQVLRSAQDRRRP